MPQLVAQIPWGHNIIILEKVKDPVQREWYLRKTLEKGWSRNILAIQIDIGLFERQEAADKTTNFALTLPPPQSDMARDVLKDSYVFDFLSLGDDALERDIERALLQNISRFLVEMGSGFAFMGNQYPLEVGGRDFYIDLLFYQHRLRCLVAVELKIGEFEPEYAGKMNFYLSALDDLVKHPEDRPSIGLILCASRNRAVAAYALRDLSKPIALADYILTRELPEDLVRALPDPRELERIITVGSDLESGWDIESEETQPPSEMSQGSPGIS